jgi:E3 ubiquitin-protein ligase HUWE1
VLTLTSTCKISDICWVSHRKFNSMGFLDIADEMADAPVFVNPPGMGILPPPPDLADPGRVFSTSDRINRIIHSFLTLDLEMIFGQHRETLPPGGQDPLQPPWDLAPTFDHFLDFTPIRSNNRRMRANVRLQDMLGGLGGPAVQMLQDMARMHPGDIQFAFSGNAAHLFFNSDPTLDPQMRTRVTQYLDARPRRGRDMRDGSSAMLSTQGRWADEARINAGPTYQERLDNLGNHVIVALLPAAREAADIASEKAEREAKEAEEKAKTEREEAELKAKEELEAQQKHEAEEAAERQREEEAVIAAAAEEAVIAAAAAAAATAAAAAEAEAAAQAASQLEDTTRNAETRTSGAPEPNLIIPDEPVASTSGTQPAPSTEPARIVVMYQGQEVDITDADIDPEFLQAVPDDIRDEIIGNYVREQQRQARPSRPAETEMDLEFLNALPADIREDVIRGQAAQITGVPAEMDAASVLATLPEELRQTVLLEQDDGTLQALPSSVIAEVNALRAQQQSRRMPASMLQPDRELNPPVSRKPPPHREAVQLLDKSGIANLVRLLFYTDTNRRTALQQVLVNLSENNKSRNDLLTLLLVMLQGGKNDIGGVDKIFSQLSVRGSAKAHSSGKGKHKETDAHPATASTASTLPDEVIVQRSLDTLTAIVNANELASLYFLTEQELPHSLQRTSSKKGKGKDRQEPPAHYPFVQLLTLLERHHLLQQSHMLDAISSLLCTVTKPLATLREVKDDTPEDKSKEEKPVEQSQAAEVPAQPSEASLSEQPQQSLEAVVQSAEVSTNGKISRANPRSTFLDFSCSPICGPHPGSTHNIRALEKATTTAFKRTSPPIQASSIPRRFSASRCQSPNSGRMLVKVFPEHTSTYLPPCFSHWRSGCHHC